MIKFFRKIRQRLLTENKFSKYLIYAIGEIVLVVIGILIALSINNWNQDRINSNKQHDYLIGLKTDLEKQIAHFSDSDKFYNMLIGQCESILEDFSSFGKLSEIDSINKKLSFLMYTRDYPEITTTFNELNSTGQLNLIKNKSLRSQTIEYYQNSEQHSSNVNANTKTVFANQIFPALTSTVVLCPENFGFGNNKIHLEDNLKTVFDNNLNNPIKEFDIVNAVSLRIIVGETNKTHVGISKDEAELLLKNINAELELY